MAVMDLSGRFLQVNHALCELLDRTEEQLLAMTCQQITQPDSQANDLGCLGPLLNGDVEVLRPEIRVRRNGDGARWIRVSLTLARDEGGAPQAIIGVVDDVSEHRNAQQNLQESEERFRKIFEEGQLGIAVVGEDLRIIRVNPAMCRILGYTAEELQERTFPQVTHPDDIEADVDLARSLFRGEIPYYQIEKRYLRKDGRQIWGHLTASVIRDRAGRPIYGLGMVEDITDRKLAEQRAQEASLATARFSLLSGREREVLELVVAGLANKVIAQRLRITERTVEKHRANAMRKLQAQSTAELVRLALIAQQAGLMS